MTFRDGMRMLHFAAQQTGLEPNSNNTKAEPIEKNTKEASASSKKNKSKQNSTKNKEADEHAAANQQFCDVLIAQLSAFGIVQDVQAHLETTARDNEVVPDPERWAGVVTMHSPSEAMHALESTSGSLLIVPSSTNAASKSFKLEMALAKTTGLAKELASSDERGGLLSNLSNLSRLFLQIQVLQQSLSNSVNSGAISEAKVLSRFRHCGELTCVRMNADRMHHCGLCTPTCKNERTGAVVAAGTDSGDSKSITSPVWTDDDMVFELEFIKVSAALRALEDLQGMYFFCVLCYSILKLIC
jgi:hypothetical protein